MIAPYRDHRADIEVLVEPLAALIVASEDPRVVLSRVLFRIYEAVREINLETAVFSYALESRDST